MYEDLFDYSPTIFGVGRNAFLFLHEQTLAESLWSSQ